MKRAKKIIAIVLIILLLSVGVTFWWLQTEAGQDFITKQTVSYLRDKIHTQLNIKRVRFSFPDWLSLEGVYLEDTKGDTLIAGERLYVNLGMMGLLSGEVGINKVEVEGLRVNLNRTLPDTVFNFQFIVDAFSTPDSEPAAPSEPMKMWLDEVSLKNVHVTYHDDVTGINTNAKVGNGKVNFTKFNPSLNQYHPNLVSLSDGNITLDMYEALPSDTTASAPLDIQPGTIALKNIRWAFQDKVSGISNGIILGDFRGEVGKLDLTKQVVNVRKFDLSNTTAFVELAKIPKEQIVTTTPASPSGEPGWTVRVTELNLTDNAVRFDDQNSLALKKGMDYAHLDLKQLNLSLYDFVYATDKITGTITKGTLLDKSGFELRQLQTEFAYTNTETYLKKLILKTPQTILADELQLTYSHKDALTNNLGNVKVKLNLVNSRVGFSDVLKLAPDLSKTPPFDKNPNGFLSGNARITGTVNQLTIEKASFSTLSNTNLSLSGTISGLPDTEKLRTNLKIQQLASTRADLLKMIPDSLLPTSIEIPEKISIAGTIEGGMQDLRLNTQLVTSTGNATLSGNLKDITNTAKAGYNGTLGLQDFDLGKLLKQPKEKLGAVTLTANFDGHGLDPKTMQANVSGTVNSASVNGYLYNNLTLTGTIDKGNADVEASIKDNNIDLALVAKADLSKESPALSLTTQINALNLNALHLYQENLEIKGNIVADFASMNLENPLGKVDASNLIITTNGKAYPLDSVSINLSKENNIQNATIKSPFFNADISGNFSYAALPDIIIGEIDKYFKVSDTVVAVPQGPYAMLLKGQMKWHPVLQAFAPALTKMDPAYFSGKLNSTADTTLYLHVNIPFVEYDSTKITSTTLSIAGDGTAATINGSLGEAVMDGFRIRRAFLAGDIKNDKLLFDFTVKDSVDVVRHALSGQLAHANKNYVFNLKKNLKMDYRNWRTDSTGKITYGPQGLLVSNFEIRRGRSQKINIHSLSDQANGPIRIIADSVAIGPFVTLFTMDSTLAKGRLDARVDLSNYMESPSFAGDLTIKNLIVTKIPVGDLKINATNKVPGKINIDAKLTDAENDIALKGDYLNDAKNPFDFSLDINKLTAKTVEAFSFGQLRNAKGIITGQTTLKGSTTDPRLTGDVRFDDVAFNVSMLGARYRIKDSKVSFANENVTLKNFVLTDTLNNKLTVDGTVKLVNIPNVNYDLRINTDKFYILDASRKDNDYFYGKGVVQARIGVKGIGSNSVINGNVKLLGESNISVLIPDNAAGAEATEGVVEFVDMDNLSGTQSVDSAAVKKVLSTSLASELSLNIETDKNAQFTIVVDEMNGDNLKVKGDAQLNVGIAPNGEIYILGAYNLNEGTYDLTFQVLKKQFQIKKGSSMIWTGDPLDAELNITAVYRVSADPTPIDPGQSKSYGKVPLDVELRIGGTINNLKIGFGIAAAETADEGIRNLLKENRVFENLANNEAELNKQVFALLVLNKFMTDQSGSASLDGFSAEAMARQSVSKLLTEQLNMLASDLIKGVNLDLNVNSTADMASGSKTDLNVGLSKAFLNDRLTVSVGRNFELENSAKSAQSTEIFDNIAVNYALTKDGRYKIRAYRKNQYQAVLEGFIIETGLSFVMTFDYDLFKEIFKK